MKAEARGNAFSSQRLPANHHKVDWFPLGYNLLGKYLWRTFYSGHWAGAWTHAGSKSSTMTSTMLRQTMQRGRNKGLWSREEGNKGNRFCLRVTKAPQRQRWVLGIDANIGRGNGKMRLRLCWVQGVPKVLGYCLWLMLTAPPCRTIHIPSLHSEEPPGGQGQVSIHL